jgi:hypothetical protein
MSTPTDKILASLVEQAIKTERATCLMAVATLLRKRGVDRNIILEVLDIYEVKNATHT